MRRIVLILGTVFSAAFPIGVNFGSIRGVMSRIRRPRNKRTATWLALVIATVISVPNIRHGSRFAELAEKSTENIR